MRGRGEVWTASMVEGHPNAPKGIPRAATPNAWFATAARRQVTVHVPQSHTKESSCHNSTYRGEVHVIARKGPVQARHRRNESKSRWPPAACTTP